jgi:hypothetical protein
MFSFVSVPRCIRFSGSKSFQLSRRQLPITAYREIPYRHRTDRCSYQLTHPAAERFDHAPNLSVTAFGDCYFQERGTRGIAQTLHNAWPRGSIIQIYPVREPADRFIIENR